MQIDDAIAASNFQFSQCAMAGRDNTIDNTVQVDTQRARIQRIALRLANN